MRYSNNGIYIYNYIYASFCSLCFEQFRPSEQGCFFSNWGREADCTGEADQHQGSRSAMGHLGHRWSNPWGVLHFLTDAAMMPWFQDGSKANMTVSEKMGWWRSQPRRFSSFLACIIWIALFFHHQIDGSNYCTFCLCRFFTKGTF